MQEVSAFPVSATGTYIIQNSLLHVSVSAKGAELQSIINKNSGIEYLWNGDPAFWAKKSPVLFPVVGGLKNNSYTHNGQVYKMGRHGFARDMQFEVSWQKPNGIMFTLVSNEETMAAYPFPFSFSVRYTIESNELSVAYIVENTGFDTMYFSVGGHPAFKVPFAGNSAFDDYFLQFSKAEQLDKWPLTKEGLLENYSKTLMKHTTQLPLLKELFYNDALVFKKLASKYVFIRSSKSTHGIKVHIAGFPYLGIWSAKDADFVCIEPWCGIADSVDASGKLEEKEGINKLAAAQTFEKTWSVEMF